MATTDNGVFTLTDNSDGEGTQTLTFDSGSESDLISGLNGLSGNASGTNPLFAANEIGIVRFFNVSEIVFPAAKQFISDGYASVAGTVPMTANPNSAPPVGYNVGIEFRVDGTAKIIGGTQLLGGLDPVGIGTVDITVGSLLGEANCIEKLRQIDQNR